MTNENYLKVLHIVKKTTKQGKPYLVYHVLISIAVDTAESEGAEACEFVRKFYVFPS